MLSWNQVIQYGVMWGPGILILAGLFALLRRPPGWIGDFVASQQANAVAMAKLASAVEDMSTRSSKLDELLVNDQVILRWLEDIQRELATRPA